MTKRQSLSTIWDSIFRDHDIINKINSDGKYIISSKLLNEYPRDARLLVKFDHNDQIPKIFKKEKLGILPIDNGLYTIGSYSLFKKHKNIEGTKIQEIFTKFELESLDLLNVTSESVALHVVTLSGILNDFIGEDVVQTISGRMRANPFDFKIDSLNSKEANFISVEKPQIEIDGGYEGNSKLVLVEAKNVMNKDFMIRQLYYPFRHWDALVNKDVIPVFMIYDDGIYNLFEYKFVDADDYSSIELVKYKRYVVKTVKSETKKNNIVLEKEQLIDFNWTDIPFPQADSFNTIIDVYLHFDELKTAKNVASYLDYEDRQGNYYISALRFLGLVERDTIYGEYKYSEFGSLLKNVSASKFNNLLFERIYNSVVFRETFDYFRKNGEIPNDEFIIDIMSNYDVQLNETTTNRRIRTVISWVNWMNGVIL